MSALAAACSSSRLAEVFADPLRALLLWGVVLSGRVNRSICAVLGLRDVDISVVEAAYAQELLELRAISASIEVLQPDELGRIALARIGLQFFSMAQTDRGQALYEATRALSRLPLWLRDPELDKLEREARRAVALARIEEVNARRAEAAARRSEAQARSGAAPVPVAPGPATAKSVGMESGTVGPKAAGPEVNSYTAADAEPVVPGADSAAEVKSDSSAESETAIPGADSAQQVKSPPLETVGQPAAGPGRPVAQGRRKLPKAARKAANLARR